MRAGRRWLPAAAVLAVALGASVAPARAAVVVGIGDQNAASFGDGRLRALALPVARLVIPYDAATSEPDRVASWLAAVAAAGMAPHIAFEHRRSDRCPGTPCVVPSRATYAAAVQRFIARFPQVRTYTTWNEANHQSQPVATQPETVAGYYEELRAACSGCTVVAGDVLDSGSFVRWLQRFNDATSTNPRLWGLHNYGDVTYNTTEGTDAVLAALPGDLWLEETGGIVALRNSAGRTTLSQTDQDAAASVTRAFSLLSGRPRITRMYVYHWKSTATARFDSGLVRPDDSLRPSYTAVVQGLAALRATAAPVTPKATVASTVRVTTAWSKAKGNVLLVRVRCLAANGRCVGRVRASIRTRRVKGATTQVKTFPALGYRTTSARRVQTLRIVVSRKVRSRARAARTRHLTLRVVPTTPKAAAATVTRKLPKPR